MSKKTLLKESCFVSYLNQWGKISEVCKQNSSKFTFLDYYRFLSPVGV